MAASLSATAPFARGAILKHRTNTGRLQPDAANARHASSEALRAVACQECSTVRGFGMGGARDRYLE